MSKARQVPVFNLQMHHSKVEVPFEFDMRDLAKKYSVFPLKLIQHQGQKRLLLAMVNPFDHQAIRDVEFRSNFTVMPVQADRVDVQWLIQVHYYGRKLSPTASAVSEQVSHDVFAQLEMTTDEQKRPEWVRDGLQAFNSAESEMQVEASQKLSH